MMPISRSPGNKTYPTRLQADIDTCMVCIIRYDGCHTGSEGFDSFDKKVLRYIVRYKILIVMVMVDRAGGRLTQYNFRDIIGLSSTGVCEGTPRFESHSCRD